MHPPGLGQPGLRRHQGCAEQQRGSPALAAENCSGEKAGRIAEGQLRGLQEHLCPAGSKDLDTERAGAHGRSAERTEDS